MVRVLPTDFQKHCSIALRNSGSFLASRRVGYIVGYLLVVFSFLSSDIKLTLV